MSSPNEVSPGAAPARARARRGDGDLLREEILDAAEELLVEKGNVEALSVRQIAKRVGCTPTSLYLHFADRDELVFCLCTRRFTEFHATLLSATEGIEDPSEALMAMGRAYVAYGVARPEAYRVLFGVAPDKVIPPGVDRDALPGMLAFGLLVDKVAAGVELGHFHAPDPLAASIGIWATMHGLVSLLDGYNDGMIEIPDGIIDVVCRQAMDGLRIR
jgi:AcrR family transcriptional regulator